MVRSKIIVFVFCILLFAGCATIGSLQPGRGATYVVSKKSYDEVWKAAITVVSRSLTIVESNKEHGIIKAEKRAGLFTWGEVVGVFINPPNIQSKQYIVEVISKKRLQTQITGQNWAPTIIAGMKAELGI